MSSKKAMKQAQKQAFAKHRSNITNNSRFGKKNRNYNNKSKKYTPDFRSLPSGGITFNPLDGKAYRKETDGTITPLDPINLKPLSKVDGTES